MSIDLHANEWTVSKSDNAIYIFGNEVNVIEPTMVKVPTLEATFLIQCRPAPNQYINPTIITEIISKKCGYWTTNSEWENCEDAIRFLGKEEKQSVWGYQGQRKYTYLKYGVTDFRAYEMLIRVLKKYDKTHLPFPYEIHNVRLPLLDVCAQSAVSHHSLIRYDTQTCALSPSPLSIADVKEIQWCELYWDIETFASKDNTMNTDPTIIGDVIFMICMHFVLRDGTCQTYLIFNDPSPESALPWDTEEEGAILLTCASEKELLEAFIALWQKHQPDWSYGFNTSGFDWPYFYKRCNLHDVPFGKLSRIPNQCPATLEEMSISSDQIGDKVFWKLTCPGTNDVDLYTFIKEKMPSGDYPTYSLNTVLNVVLGESKDDMSYVRLYAAYRDNHRADLKAVAKYCIRDTIPLRRVQNKLDLLNKISQYANISVVPSSWILNHGVSRQIVNKLLSKSIEIGMTMPNKVLTLDEPPENEERANEEDIKLLFEDILTDDAWYDDGDERPSEPYGGATVLDVKKAFLKRVATVDFSSLYPSIQQAIGACYSSVVMDMSLLEEAKKEKGGAKEHKWQVPVWHCPYTKIDYKSETAAIEGELRRQDGLRAIRKQLGKKLVPLTAEEHNIIKHGMSLSLVQLIRSHDLRFGTGRVFANQIGDLRKQAKEVVQTKYLRHEVTKSIWLVKDAAKLIPPIQRQLIQVRNQRKRERDSYPKSHHLYRVNDAAQAATKVLMNGIYGFTGGTIMPFVELAEATTATGRMLIEKVKNAAEVHFKEYCKTETWTEKDVASGKYPGITEAHIGQSLLAQDTHVTFTVVGGDTDSCFINMEGCTLNETNCLAKKFASWCTDYIIAQPPISLEFEKVSKMILQGKKNRIERIYEHDDTHYEDKSKGNALVRRNYCLYLKKMLWRITKAVFDSEDTTLVPQMVFEALQGLQDVPLSELCVTTSVSKKTLDFEHGSMNAIKDLLRRVIARNDRPIRIGERFNLVYVDRPNALDIERSEMFDFAQEANLRPDNGWYLKHLRNPFVEFAKPLCLQEEVASVFDHFEIKENIKKEKLQYIHSFLPSRDRLEETKEEKNLLRKKAKIIRKTPCTLKQSTITFPKKR